jgi:surface protein
MDLYLNLMPDLRNIVTEYFGDVIFSQAQNEVNEVTFATSEEFKKSQAADCIFINYEIISTDHFQNPDIPLTLLYCSGTPKIKTHTLASMFFKSEFNGDLSQWDVSSVTNMHGMFCNSQFNGDLSKWDVSSVTDMSNMFFNSEFNNPSLITWDVSSVTDMTFMFSNSEFNGDLSKWDVSLVEYMFAMFANSQFNNISLRDWNFSNVKDVRCMFNSSQFKDDLSLQKWDDLKVKDMYSVYEQQRAVLT